MGSARLGSICLDCDDPMALGEFWAALLGGSVAFTSHDFVAVRTDSVWISAVRTDDHRPPDWPEATVPKQIHLDLAVDDLDEAEDVALALGAVRAAKQPAPDRWRVLLDPAGHPFCLSTQIPDEDGED
jgi:hypothetical protein